jgi:hypothetical protein
VLDCDGGKVVDLFDLFDYETLILILALITGVPYHSLLSIFSSCCLRSDDLSMALHLKLGKAVHGTMAWYGMWFAHTGVQHGERRSEI